jgi:glycogen synthase
MELADRTAAGGRVVMLVDNAVNGDSRVQKAARSAADAGWTVTLLGRSPNGVLQTWPLGSAEVRLLPMPVPLTRRRHEYRRAWLRWPLAYPPTGIAEHRAAWVRAWRSDLATRQALLTRAVRGGRRDWRVGLAQRRLRLETLAARAMGLWVRGRTKMLSRARSGRRFRGPWDRGYTLFWRLVKGDGAWRRLEPGLWDFELAYGPVIDKLDPDLIHAHDFRMLGVGARAVIRASAKGRTVKLVWDAHEFVPGIKPWQDHARWLPAHTGYEREYAPYADAAVSVSPTLSEMLRAEHHLPYLPAVVLNAPSEQDARAVGGAHVPDLRGLCGIGRDVPLVVYSGGVARQRGLDVMVEGLPRLPGTHVAFIVNRPGDAFLREVLARADRLGVRGRVHVLGYVPHDQVVPFLAAADVGVIPIHHWPNHEIALITKFFEYSHARLPVVVSDVRTMAETTRATGQGEVFRAQDTDDYVRAVRAVLADPARYRAAYDRPGLLEEWTWETQAVVIEEVYRRLLPDRPGRESRTVAADRATELAPSPVAEPTGVTG